MDGYLNITESKLQGKGRWSKVIASNSQFFANNEYLIVTANEECLQLSVPTIDYDGKMSKVCRTKNTNWYAFSITIPVPCGTHFEFDEEESNEDKVVVYFN